MTALLKSVQGALVDGQEVSLYELLYLMKINGDMDAFHRATTAMVVRKAGADAGISITDNELQHEADAARKAAGLNKSADTLRWLREQALTEEDFEASCEYRLVAEKLKEKVTFDKIESYFDAHRSEFDGDLSKNQAAVADRLWDEWLIGEIERVNARFTLPSIIA
jgi:hypothetical protein